MLIRLIRAAAYRDVGHLRQANARIKRSSSRTAQIRAWVRPCQSSLIEEIPALPMLHLHNGELGFNGNLNIRRSDTGDSTFAIEVKRKLSKCHTVTNRHRHVVV